MHLLLILSALPLAFSAFADAVCFSALALEPSPDASFSALALSDDSFEAFDSPSSLRVDSFPAFASVPPPLSALSEAESLPPPSAPLSALPSPFAALADLKIFAALLLSPCFSALASPLRKDEREEGSYD